MVPSIDFTCGLPLLSWLRLFRHYRLFMTCLRLRAYCTGTRESLCLLRRVLDIHCQIDSSKCLAQLTPASVGKARSVHVQLGASPHVIRWDIVCLSPQSHTSVWESFHISTFSSGSLCKIALLVSVNTCAVASSGHRQDWPTGTPSGDSERGR